MVGEQNTHIHIREDGTVIRHSHGPGENGEPMAHGQIMASDEAAPRVSSVHFHEDGGHVHAEETLRMTGHSHEQEEEAEHTHIHTHGGHPHVHTNTKAVLNRISRAIGHLESIKRMVEEGRDCSEVLIQLSAVKSAINNTGKVILQDHIEHCIVDAVESGDREVLIELEKAIDRFIK